MYYKFIKYVQVSLFKVLQFSIGKINFLKYLQSMTKLKEVKIIPSNIVKFTQICHCIKTLKFVSGHITDNYKIKFKYDLFVLLKVS